MTIKRGEEWGREVDRPVDMAVVRTDQELRRLVDAARRTRRSIPGLDLRGGDLASTIGLAGPARAEDRPPPTVGGWRALPIDLARVTIDGIDHWFAAHLVARRTWWRGPIIAAMNAQFIGDWDVAPRAHPNDGRLDVFEVDRAMTVAQRWQARKRLRLGTHVPHPAITERRMDRLQFETEQPLDFWLDGELVVRGREALVVVEPDAAVVYIRSVG